MEVKSLWKPFGSLRDRDICAWILAVGSVLNAVAASLFGYLVAQNTFYDTWVELSDGWYTSQYVPNVWLGLLAGVVAFLVNLLFLRLFSEILYRVLKSLPAKEQAS